MPGWWPDYWLVYVPLGLIGIIRWSVWLLRKIPALLYRPQRPLGPLPDVSVITPVYNEDPEGFRSAVLSWIAERPTEIIAVIDAGDKRCIDVFGELMASQADAEPKLVLIVTTVPGKRPALAEGIRGARSELVALVDSDTLWETGVLAAATAPFSDDRVGGVGTRQNVHRPEHVWQQIADIVLDLRFHDELPFLGRTGGYLTCLSGRTAFYRREVLLPLLPHLVHEEFLGEVCISGEDKRLTYLVQAAGYETRYQSNARVYTFMPADFATFLKQRIRWSRNTWRADLRALTQRWSWRQPVFALFLIDRSISPLTSMIAPSFMVLSLASGHWVIAGTLWVWWLVSRAVKIWPHLVNRPGDIRILPVYILVTYLLATVKVYALLTLNWQGWLTRGLSKPARLQIGHLAMNGITVVATMVTVSLVLAGVLLYGAIVGNRGEEAAKSSPLDEAVIEPAAIPPPLVLAVTQVADPPLPPLLQTTLEEREHIVTAGQSLSSIANDYFGDPGYWRILAFRNNQRPPYVIHPGERLVIPTANLPLPPAPNKVSPAVVTYDAATNTITVKGRETAVQLSEIAAQAPTLLSQVAPGEWLLSANLLITDRVTLDMRGLDKGGDVNWLKLKSDETGFVIVKAADGRILMENTRVTSWDTIRQTYDMNIDDGRAFVLAKNQDTDIADTRMDILTSELSYLGYGASESYGVSWRVSKTAPKVVTGTVIGSRFFYNYFGAFTFGAKNMIWRGNEFAYNIGYGLDPHDDSNNFLVEYNSFHDNGRHGMIFSKRCIGNVIRYNTSENNKLHGFMLHMDSNNNLVENNIARNNTDGFAIYDSRGNVLRNNISESNRKSGFRINGTRPDIPAQDNYISDNQIKGNGKGIYIYGAAPRTVIVRNSITQQSRAGINVRSDSNQIGAADQGNDLQRNKSGIVLDEGARGNIVEGNRVLENAQDGVLALGAFTTTIQRNLITNNRGRGIRVEGSPDTILLLNELTSNKSFNVTFENSPGGRAAGNVSSGGSTRSYSIRESSTLTVEDEEANTLTLDRLSSVDLIDRDGNVLYLGDGRFSRSLPEGTMVRVRIRPEVLTAQQLKLSVSPAGIALDHQTGQIQVSSLRRAEEVTWLEEGTDVAGPVGHVVQGLSAGVTYRFEVDGTVGLTTTAGPDGIAAFSYDGDYSGLRRFRLTPEQSTVRDN